MTDWIIQSNKNEGLSWFSQVGRAAPRDFWRAMSYGNPKEQPFQPEENPVHPDTFTQNPMVSELLLFFFFFLSPNYL